MILKENRKKFLIGIFGVGFLVLGFWFFQTSKAEAAVYLGCAKNPGLADGSASSCGWRDTDSSVLRCESTKWCMINPWIPSNFTHSQNPSSCYDSTNNRYCRENACYDINTQNGATCTVIKGIGGVTGGCDKNTKASGKWEASTKSCIQCSGAGKI